MRTSSIGYIATLFVMAAPAVAQIQPNSQFFNVANYLYPAGNGNWLEYRATGFAQPAVQGVPARLFMMPRMRLTRNSVKFSDNVGNAFDPNADPSRRAKTIGVTVGFDLTLPTEVQRPAIGAALSGISATNYLAPWPTQPGGDPVMHPATMTDFNLRQAVIQSFQAYKAETEKLKGYADKYATYVPMVATLQELRVALIVDGDEVAVRSFPGTAVLTGSALPQISIQEPTEYVQNKLASGDFEVLVGYRFLDAKTSSIQATFNTRQAVSQFIEETQRAVTQRKSSGWQVLGIGSRRSKMKSSLEQSMKSNTEISNMQGTRVVMYDATDDMVERFEQRFFPQLSKSDAIERHLDAANKAQEAGNLELAKVHRDYAAALQANDTMKEVDTAAAAAALTAGDYAGFIAHGVRMSNQNHTMTNNFRRVVDVNVEVIDDKEWTEVKTVSVLRETSLPVLMEEKKRYVATIGLMSGGAYAFPFVRQNQWGQPEFANRTGLLATGILPGGPLGNAGILPGAVITAIGNYAPTNAAELENALANFEAGETITVKVLVASGRMPTPFQPGQWGQEQNVTVKLGRRPAPISPEDI